MANKGNFIDAESLIQKLNTAFNEHKIAIEQSAQALKGLEGAYSKLPSDYIKAQKQVLDLQSKQVTVEGKLIDLSAKKERLAQTEIRTQKLITSEKDKANKAREKELALLAKEEAKQAILSNVYSKTQRQLNLVTAEYNNLSAKKARYNILTENEEKRLVTLTNVSKKYQLTLQGIDSAVGKYSRNVGNYASGFNPLSNAIGQISRELPNFGQSMQIGIMSITNNIGALQDAIKGIVAQNAILKAEGQATRSVMSQIGATIMSFNTLLYVGIAVLNAYGKEIGLWIESLFEGDKALKELNDRQKEFNNSKLTGRKDAQAEILELRKYLAVLNDSKLSEEQRKIAKDAILKQYPYYIKSVKDAMLVDGEYSKGVNDLITALEKRKEVEKKSDINVTNRQRLIDLESQKEALDGNLESLEKTVKLRREQAQGDAQFSGALATAEDRYKTALKERARINKEISLINKDLIKNETDIIQLKKETIGLEYQEEKASKAKVKQKKKEAEQLKQFTEDWFQAEISKLEAIRAKVADTTLEYASYTNQINVLKMLLDQLQGKETPDTLRKEQLEALDEGIKKMKSYEDATTDSAKATNELEKATNGFIESFNKSFLGDAGLPTMDIFLRLEENGKTVFQNLLSGADTLQEKFQVTFLAISQVAEEAFAFIDKFGQENFDAQYRRLEQQRDVAIQFAGESTTAQDEINNQFDARRRAIERRQAESEKRSAIFKAIINTAQAVVSALPNIPLSVAVGLIGAGQIALIQSQQIPQFWTGTDNAPEGMAWTQEKGREIITDKSGKIKSMGSDKGAQMTYLSKGDKVFNASETEALMFNSSLNNMLLGSGIMMPKVEVSMDTTVLGNKIDNLANTIANKPSFTLVKDAKGERVYMRKQAEIKELQNARLNIRGYDI